MKLIRIISVLALGVLMLSAGLAEESQCLKPWQFADGPDLEEQWTTEYMTSRPPRLVQTINRDWTFNYFPSVELTEQAAEADYDDAKWPAVAVPHTWQTYETTGLVHPFMMYASESAIDARGRRYGKGDVQHWWRGWAWYRKRFQPTLTAEQLKEKQIFVEFEAVMKYCKVYLNGQYVGDHKGGYNAFYFNITPYLKPQRENVLAVAVNNSQRDAHRIPPMFAGNWNCYGGITRDVRLVVKDRLHIPFQGSYRHEGGTFVTTPSVSAERGVCRVRTWVRNDYSDQRSCTLSTTITDAEGKTIAQQTASGTIEPGELKQFDQTFPPVEKPHLWSSEKPYLYRVCSEVRQRDRVTDRYESPLGFRWFSWDYRDNWLILNGKKTHIHGTNYVQEYPWLGEAMPEWMHIKDMKDIRFGLQHNFLRPCIHGQDPLVYDFCDRFGVLLNVSQPNVKNCDFAPEVQKQMVREAVRRNRNRPSVIFWSVGNETPRGADSQWVHDEDDTRIIHARKVDPASYGKFVWHTHVNMDMENLLRVTVRGWTDNDVKAAEPPNGQHAGNEEWQHAMARVQDGNIRGRLDMHNGVMWLYDDYGAARVYKDIPLRNVNPKGWVDVYRVPKYVYFLWRANYVADQPVVFIHPHPWQEKHLGRKKDIIVDSNCDRVELQINGHAIEAMDRPKSDFGAFVFKQVSVTRGRLTAVGAKGGRTVRAIVDMSGPASEVRLTASASTIEAARDAIVVVAADAVDARGAQVQGFRAPIRWRIDGPAKLVGPDRYDTDIDKTGAAGGMWYMATPVCNVVRSSGKPGAIRVVAECDGLKPGQLVIRALTAKNQPIVAREIPLSDKGRMPLTMVGGEAAPAMNPAVRMAQIQRDFQFSPGKGEVWYAVELDKIIRRSNPNLAAQTDVIKSAVHRLAGICATNDGAIVADDYNFIVAQVNEALQLADDLRQLRLPAEFVCAQKAYYLDQIVCKGRAVDTAAVLRNLDGVANDAVAVVAKSEDLRRVLANVHPSLKLEDQKKLMALWNWIATLNPCVDASIFRVQKGAVVLIPGAKSLQSRGFLPCNDPPSR